MKVLRVERGEDFGWDRVQEGADGQVRAQAGVDPALHADHQHRLVQFGVGQEDYPVVDFIVHQCCSKICLAVRASMVMWAGNSLTLPRSPAVAPAL